MNDRHSWKRRIARGRRRAIVRDSGRASLWKMLAHDRAVVLRCAYAAWWSEGETRTTTRSVRRLAKEYELRITRNGAR
jgi:hypothetical protein